MGNYLSAVERVLEQFSPRRRLSPAQLLNQWAEFVAEAVKGYPYGWYEFDNERSVRDAIQAIRDDAIVKSFPEANEWFERVDAVDNQYRQLLIGLPEMRHEPWWRAGVPRYAGRQLAEDLRRMFGMEVETWS